MKRGTPDHPKTYRLAHLLKVPRVTAVGALEMLWHWTGKYSPRGDVGRWSPEAIASWFEWPGDADMMIDGFRTAGFLCETSEIPHVLLVHDWKDHAEDSVKKHLRRNALTILDCRVLCPHTEAMSGHVQTTGGHVSTTGGHVSHAVAVALATTNELTEPPPPPFGGSLSPDPLKGALTTTGACATGESRATDLCKARDRLVVQGSDLLGLRFDRQQRRALFERLASGETEEHIRAVWQATRDELIALDQLEEIANDDESSQ